MIVDTSAIVAIIRQEPDAAFFAAVLESSPVNRISAGTWLELAIVIDRARDPLASRQLDALLAAAEIVVEPVTASQARIAREAHRDFGKGTGHRAGLNLGDCFAYALARALSEPLLFKGDDFTYTDIPLVGSPSERRRVEEARAAYPIGATA